MKYEPVFGDQSLFDGGPEDAVSVRYGKSEYIFDSGEIKATTGQLRDVPIVAMRRIIAEPNRWTVADQKARRLPEVGAEVIRVDHEDEGCNVIGEVIATWHCAENNESSQTCLRLKDGTLFLVECYSELRPIETPAEKAQRLRDECGEAWERATKAQAVPQWIPVSEQMPENEGTYFCLGHNGTPFVCLFRTTKYEGKIWLRSTGTRRIDGITHWMPLPAAPVKDGE